VGICLHTFGDVEGEPESVSDVQHCPERDGRVIADPCRTEEDDGEHNCRDRGQDAPERERCLVDDESIQEGLLSKCSVRPHHIVRAGYCVTSGSGVTIVSP
jgi:hypothetical protein